MKVNPKESADAYRWFIGAGIFSICLSVGLLKIDDALTNSTKEADNAQVLHTLRMSQITLPGRGVDERSLVAVKQQELSSSPEVSHADDSHSTELNPSHGSNH